MFHRQDATTKTTAAHIPNPIALEHWVWPWEAMDLEAQMTEADDDSKGEEKEDEEEKEDGEMEDGEEEEDAQEKEDSDEDIA